VAERSRLRDPRHTVNKHRRLGSREAAQQHGAFFELFLEARQQLAVEKRDHNAVPSLKSLSRQERTHRTLGDTVLCCNHTLPRKQSIFHRSASSNAVWRG
jgi:hypothetical protein